MKSTQADQLARVGGWMKTIHFGLTVSMSHPSDRLILWIGHMQGAVGCQIKGFGW